MASGRHSSRSHSENMLKPELCLMVRVSPATLPPEPPKYAEEERPLTAI